jgi:hypothetical protein
MRNSSSRIFSSYILAIVFLAMACAVCAFAQGQATQPTDSGKSKVAPYALIFGTVWDAQNRPVYGVPIKIRRADQKKAKWQVMSDHHGEFAQRVPAGKADYIITAEWKPPKGKKDWKVPESKAHIENDERIDIGLHLTE